MDEQRHDDNASAGAGSPPPAPEMPGPEADVPTKDERMWAMFAHFSSLLGFAIGGLTFLGPLIIWLIKREESEFIDDQGKESLNFQITMCVAGVVIFALTLITCGMAAPLFLVLALVDVIYVILGGVKANEGKAYRYPFNWRVVS